jgi:signal transduction histidine kinase
MILETISKRPSSQNSLLPVLSALLALTVLYFFVLGFQVGGRTWANLRSELFNLPVEMVAAVFLNLVVRSFDPTVQRLMKPFYWGLMLHILSNVLRAIFEFGVQSQVGLNGANTLLWVSSAIILFGLFRIPIRKTSRTELVRLSLDVSLLILTLGILFWTSFLGNMLSFGALEVPKLFNIASSNLQVSVMPFNGSPLDVLALSVGFIVAARITNQLQRLAVLGALGLLAMVLTDAAIGALLNLGQYQRGGLLDGGFILCLTIVCLGAYLSFSPQPNSYFTRQSLASVTWLSTYAPYLATVLIYIPLIRSHLDSEFQDIVGVASAALITALVLVRQIIILNENRNLNSQLLNMNAQLEERVQERTKELEENRERLISSEKLASIGQLTAGLAHEINTPLAASLNYLHQARTLADEYAQSIGNAEVGPRRPSRDCE